MTRSIPTFAAAALLSATIAVAPAGATAGIAPAQGFVPRQAVLKLEGADAPRTVSLRVGGAGVRRTVAALNRDPRVVYAAPNYIATASTTPLQESGVANDPGLLTQPPGPPGGWVALQWNFLPWQGTPTAALPVSPGGIDAVGAWRNLVAGGRPGASGVTVAVLDTGVAYRDHGSRFRRSPDFAGGQFVPGYDFVGNDRLPLDENGHGTHVAGTIAEKTNNGVALVGLAYRAKLMPVRVLDRNGSGEADDIAHGIHFAVSHGADVINMSFNFGCGKKVPGIEEELRYAYREGTIVVASIGNLGSEACVSSPATGPHVLGVGGTTEGGCLGGYSLLPGKGVDLLAPGGGTPMVGCPSVLSRSIYQVTLKGGNPHRFAEPATYVGTSMAAAHASGVAAMVLASGLVPKDASPQNKVNEVTKRLRSTARDLGLPAQRQGAGLIDAGKATRPST